MRTHDYEYLEQHICIWEQKKVLRRIYEEQFYCRLLEKCVPGKHVVEIGSGPGFIASYAPSVWRTDILPSKKIHCAADAHQLPFAAKSLDNIIGLDVLHHCSRPLLALAEMTRVLRPGGRVVLIEPWITPLSRLVYTYLHQEDCNLDIQPWGKESVFGGTKHAFDGNAAIPYVLINDNASPLKTVLPSLELLTIERFSLFTYLLSLGFKPHTLLPLWAYPVVHKVEVWSRPLWSRVAALRAVLVWERVY